MLAMVPVPEVLQMPVDVKPLTVAVRAVDGKCEQSVRLGMAAMVAC